MSTRIKDNLAIIKQKLNDIEKFILNGKKLIADAISYNGVKGVNPSDDNPNSYDTFDKYAEYIDDFRYKDPLILEYNIQGNTSYKKTVIAPMGFGWTPYGSQQDVIDGITLKLIEQDKKAMEESGVSFDYSENDESEEYTTTDYSMNYSINYETDNSLNSGPIRKSGRAIDDSVPYYKFTINWGDGSGDFEYDPNKTFEENQDAIYHTYKENGVYDVSISGLFRCLCASTHNILYLIKDGKYVLDVDGQRVYTNTATWAGTNYLTEVISWGNTKLVNCGNGLCGCHALTTIPIYDTLNSFENLKYAGYMFYGDYKLKKIPYNEKTKRGLFSNCKELQNTIGTFLNCSGITGGIPTKLLDGCSSLISISSIFESASLTGDFPEGFFKGLSSLQDASSAFANCNITGTLSNDLFADCPKLYNLSYCFRNCGNMKGIISDDFIGNLSNLSFVQGMFNRCKSITGISAGAFKNIKRDGINFVNMFEKCTGITELPKGLLSSLTGKNIWVERMFDSCTGLTKIDFEDLAQLKPCSARGMFQNCKNLTGNITTEHPDWSSEEYIRKWYGCFGNTNISNKSDMPLELGFGNSDAKRRFKDGHVGMICMMDKETKDYSFLECSEFKNEVANNTLGNRFPIGWCYADEYIDKTLEDPFIKDSVGNITDSSNENAVKKVFVSMFNNQLKTYVDTELHLEAVDTMRATGDINLSYMKYSYNNDGTQTRARQRMNGEAYTKAIADFIDKKSYDISRYPAYKYVKEFNYSYIDSRLIIEGCYLGDGADMWSSFVEIGWMTEVCNVIANSKIGFNSDTCLPFSDNVGYWCTPESNAKQAWFLNGGSAVNTWGYKWYYLYVRPVKAFAV